MLIQDIKKYKIRVLLNPLYVNIISKNAPIDVIGTVLYITVMNDYTNTLLLEGRILDIICNPIIKTEGSMVIRWDNDIKSSYTLGKCILISSTISRCKSIWKKEDNILEDTRPYHTLKPKTLLKRPDILQYKKVAYKARTVKDREKSLFIVDSSYNNAIDAQNTRNDRYMTFNTSDWTTNPQTISAISDIMDNKSPSL